MSDGPHKSLPMKRRWKRVAERAHKPAFSLDQIAEAVGSALGDDWRSEVPKPFRQALEKIVLASDSLFQDQAKHDLAALSRQCASPLQSALVEEVLGAMEMGLRKSQALEAGVAGALAQRGMRAVRQIEEHIVIREGRGQPGLRGRLEAAVREDQVRNLARSLLSGSRRQARPPRLDGVEQGPAL